MGCSSLYKWKFNDFAVLSIFGILWAGSYLPSYAEEFAASYGTLSPEARAEALASYTSLKFPQRGESFPLAVLLPGCMGWHPHHTEWEARLLKSKFAVLHVNSFKARGLTSPLELQREVCSGRQVTGDERAGDLVSVIEDVWRDPKVRSENSIIMGWSHGGWTALDFLVMLENRIKPPNLTKGLPLDVGNFRAALLFYPYCGPAGFNWTAGLPRELDGYLFHGSRDVITSPRECKRRIERLKERGGNLEFVELQNAGHWFDNRAEPAAFNNRAYSKALSKANSIIERVLAGRENVTDDFDTSSSSSKSSEDLMDLFEGLNEEY